MEKNKKEIKDIPLGGLVFSLGWLPCGSCRPWPTNSLIPFRPSPFPSILLSFFLNFTSFLREMEKKKSVAPAARSSSSLACCLGAAAPITNKPNQRQLGCSFFAAKPFHFNQLSISLPIRKRREMELMKWIGQRRYIGPLSRGETKPKSFDWFHSIKQIKDSFNFTSSNQIDCCLRYHRGSWCQYNNYCYNIFSIHSTSETKWKENLIY